MLRKLTVRIALAERVRTVIAVLEIAVIVTVALAGSVLFAALNRSQADLVSIVNSGSNASIVLADPAPTSLRSAMSKIPARLNPQPKVIDTLMPLLTTSRVGVEYFMQRPWDKGTAHRDYRCEEGRLPRHPMEIAVSSEVALWYALQVGSHASLALDQSHQVVVVGTCLQRSNWGQDFVLAAPGTWESLTPSSEVAATLAPSVEIAVTLPAGDDADSTLLQTIGSLSYSSDLTYMMVGVLGSRDPASDWCPAGLPTS